MTAATVSARREVRNHHPEATRIERQSYLTDPDSLEAEVKRAMISRSRSVSLVADTRTFESRGLNVIVPASAVNLEYLDDESQSSKLGDLRDPGAERRRHDDHRRMHLRAA
jgi:DeoR/GlpR family transcriptional regulator of sugar metabolism